VQFQKISILPSTEGIGISCGVGFSKTKHLKKCIKLNWNFQRGGGRGLGNNNKKNSSVRAVWYSLDLQIFHICSVHQ